MTKRSIYLVAVLSVLLSIQSALAQRYTPSNLCALTSNTAYESITLPLGLQAEYPYGSEQSIAVRVGDSEQPGVPTTANNDQEFVAIYIDTDNDGVPELLSSAACSFSTAAVPPGCTVTQNITLPMVVEDTSYRGRVMLSRDAATPANGCGNNGFGDSEDFLVVVNAQEFIAISDVSAPEDDGPVTVSAILSHNVRDASGFVPFTVDYLVADGTATLADNDYTTTSGRLTFNGKAGDTQTFTVSPTADSVSEGDQTILVSLQNLSNTTHGIDISDTATIKLLEDDAGIDLSILSSVDNASPDIGSTVVFTLQVKNAGPDDAVDASVQDIVPAGFSSITALSSPAGSSLAITGNTVNWTGIDVPAGAAVTATFSAIVLQP